MSLVSDIGGHINDQQIDRQPHELSDWERKIDAIMQVLSAKKLIRGDELRRAIEELPKGQYQNLLYYEKWAYAIEQLMLEKKFISTENLDRTISYLTGEKN